MRRPALLFLVTVCAIAPLTAQAGFSIGGRAGTLGLGLEAAKLITPNIAVRGALYRYSREFDRQESDVEFTVDLKFDGYTGLVDFFPSGGGSFHLTGGIMSAPAEVDGVGQPTGGTYTFNGVEYTAAEVGTVNGTVRWKKTMPYAGLGWGTPASKRGGLTFLFDLGVGIGKPTIGLTASSAVPGSTLAEDVEAERQQVQADVNKYLKVYPVVNLGLAIRF
jgi:hypothetical protein